MAFGFDRNRDAVADVSVVIPVYNHDRYVGAAIQSALRQTVRPCEIVCIDDGSTDGSVKVVEQLAAVHPEIRFWSRPNRGAHATLNEAIQASRASVVAILNSDDVYEPRRLEQCLATLRAAPEAGVVCTGIEFIDADGKRRANAWYDEALAFHRKTGDLGLSLANANFLMTTSNIVARRTTLDAVGPFDDLRYAHDLDFFLRLVANPARLVVVREKLLAYRLHGNNTISEAHGRVRMEWAAVVAFFALRTAATRGADYTAKILEIARRHGLESMISLIASRRPALGASSPGDALANADLREALAGLAA